MSLTSGDFTRCRGSGEGKVWLSLWGGNQAVVPAWDAPEDIAPSWNTESWNVQQFTSSYLGVFWRRERNWAEMLSRGLKKSSSEEAVTSLRDL